MLLPQYVIHRCAPISEPDEFRPSRWAALALPASGSAAEPQAEAESEAVSALACLMPFSLGSRNCVGQVRAQHLAPCFATAQSRRQAAGCGLCPLGGTRAVASAQVCAALPSKPKPTSSALGAAFCDGCRCAPHVLPVMRPRCQLRAWPRPSLVRLPVLSGVSARPWRWQSCRPCSRACALTSTSGCSESQSRTTLSRSSHEARGLSCHMPTNGVK